MESRKKPDAPALTKKKIDDIRTPELIIKVNYKGKRLSIPLHKIDEKGLREIVQPHVVRFEREILSTSVAYGLGNSDFSPESIENWKTAAPGDILKDFYFQTDKNLTAFKGQVLSIEPIWRKAQPGKVSLNDF